ncbi:hypothetical protein [uncultured Methanomethylovorans sp.]|uniref:hypothetical protein n=1 Tax=uncultured Methanomethylovorans sp. TaxID=183759 RepID=UPI002AA8315B|nr:hypothetical protein [uncultured Methanomethylovorans sp.]
MSKKDTVSSLRIDSEMRDIFLNTQIFHHKSLSDALHEGMLQIVREVSPVQILDMDIEAARKKVSDLEASRPHVLQIEEMNKTKVGQSTTPTVDAIFLDYRESLLDHDAKGNIITMLKRGTDPSWDRFYFKCGFQSATEAKNWFWSEAMKRGLVK